VDFAVARILIGDAIRGEKDLTPFQPAAHVNNKISDVPLAVIEEHIVHVADISVVGFNVVFEQVPQASEHDFPFPVFVFSFKDSIFESIYSINFLFVLTRIVPSKIKAFFERKY